MPLPSPPDILMEHVRGEWQYNKSEIAPSSGNKEVPFSFLSSINNEDSEELVNFEAKFKKVLYNGVSVQRLVTDSDLVNGVTRRERRVLWLMLPEVGSLRLGFISKIGDSISGSPTRSRRRSYEHEDDEDYSIYSEGASTFITMDSGLQTRGTDEYTADYTAEYTFDDTIDDSILSRQKNLRLSSSHCVALTDVVSLLREPNVSIRYSPDDATEHLRVINIEDRNGSNLLFLANNVQEADLLTCGLKLLLERETSRLGIRGGISTDGGKNNRNDTRMEGNSVSPISVAPRGDNLISNSIMTTSITKEENENLSQKRYVHGKEIVEEIVSNVILPLPFTLCRVLLLDSSSPVIVQWERDRGDTRFEKGRWKFRPGSPRESDSYGAEHTLLSKGSVAGAHRTVSYYRRRNGRDAHIVETHVVDEDNSTSVSLNIIEGLPRRGFGVKIRLYLNVRSPHSSEISVRVVIRPIGKNMSDQGAVHKAFCLLIDELKTRYGSSPNGTSWKDIVIFICHVL